MDAIAGAQLLANGLGAGEHVRGGARRPARLHAVGGALMRAEPAFHLFERQIVNCDDHRYGLTERQSVPRTMEDPAKVAERRRDRELQPRCHRAGQRREQRPLREVGLDGAVPRVREQRQVHVLAHCVDERAGGTSDPAQRALLQRAGVEGNPELAHHAYRAAPANTSAYADAQASQLKARARASPASRRSLRRAGSSSSARVASVMAVTSPSGTSTPAAPTTSVNEEFAYDTTGTPEAIDSATGSPKPS